MSTKKRLKRIEKSLALIENHLLDRRCMKYGNSQHALICALLCIDPSPESDGGTALEAVCHLYDQVQNIRGVVG